MERPNIVDISFAEEHSDVPESWKTMSQDKVLILFPSPSNIIISSPTQGGKTSFVYRLLKHDLFQQTPKNIMYCYNSTWQQKFDKMQEEIDNITFHHGMPSDGDLEDFQTSSNDHKLLVLDDLMPHASDADSILKLFTVGTHHNHCTVILLTHNIFVKSKHGRSLSLNTQIFILMANTRDILQVKTLGRQIDIPKLSDAYSLATPRPYTYFIIDLHNHTPQNLRLRSHIFPDDDLTTVYKAQ